jgi:hypothetical protein
MPPTIEGDVIPVTRQRLIEQIPTTLLKMTGLPEQKVSRAITFNAGKRTARELLADM